jgi:hypothetical protein
MRAREPRDRKPGECRLVRVDTATPDKQCNDMKIHKRDSLRSERGALPRTPDTCAEKADILRKAKARQPMVGPPGFEEQPASSGADCITVITLSVVSEKRMPSIRSVTVSDSGHLRIRSSAYRLH